VLFAAYFFHSPPLWACDNCAPGTNKTLQSIFLAPGPNNKSPRACVWRARFESAKNRHMPHTHTHKSGLVFPPSWKSCRDEISKSEPIFHTRVDLRQQHKSAVFTVIKFNFYEALSHVFSLTHSLSHTHACQAGDGGRRRRQRSAATWIRRRLFYCRLCNESGSADGPVAYQPPSNCRHQHFDNNRRIRL
jgi:hypothetical protein